MKNENLSSNDKHNIKVIVESEMDNLEDIINITLKKFIKEDLPHLFNNQEALVFAREIFFRG